MKNLFRIILFIPAMYIGLFLSVFVTAIWNMPFIFIEWFFGLFGNWSLLGLIFGYTDTTIIEIIYVLTSGIIGSLIGLYMSLVIFPYKKHRNKIIYLLLILLILGFSSQSQLEIYENMYLYYAKIIGILIGFGIIIKTVTDKKGENLFCYIDKKLK